jgi:fibronectin-binding autotransporter adhesin
MGTFSLSGGVEVVGFISPTDPQDTYPVIDPLYGIDGFRNVNNLIDLNNIPEERRRAGMVVGVSGGTLYYKLNTSPWNYTISDWSIFNSTQGITGGVNLGGSQEVFKEITGNTIYFRTISGGTNVTATTVGNVIKLDVTIPNDTNTYVTGGTISYIGSNGTITLKRNDNVDVTLTGLTDLYVTGGSYSNGVISLINNAGTSFSVSGFSTALSGDYLPLSGGTVTGSTIFTQGLSANTISATTYQNLPTDIRVTGGTYSAGTITFTNNTGGTFNVTGFLTGFTDTFVSGASYNNNTFTFTNTTGGSFNVSFNSVTGLTSTGTISSDTISATTYQNLPTDIRVTGGTYSAGTITFINNTGGTFNVTGLTTGTTSTISGDYLPLSGGTVSGSTNYISGLTANTISATTYQNLPTDIRVTGGTFSSGTITFTNNTGGTFNVTGITSADTFTTAFTYSNNVFTIGRNQNQPSLTATINTVTGWTVNGNLTVTGNTSLQAFTATTATVNGNLTVTGSSALNGTISSTNLAGSTNRVVQVNSGGTMSATADIISAYITSGGTAANLLENGTNWDINGVYTGTTITGTYQGQKHYDINYFYEAVADNLFIRLIRG